MACATDPSMCDMNLIMVAELRVSSWPPRWQWRRRTPQEAGVATAIVPKPASVTLVDQSDKFVFKPLLYELLNGGVQPWEVAPRFTELLAPTKVNFIQAKVESIDASAGAETTEDDQAGSITLANGHVVEYDWLILALGAVTRTDVVPGAMEHAIPFATLEDALKVDQQLRLLESAALRSTPQIPIQVSILIVSGDTVMTESPEGQREEALKVLKSRGVNLVCGERVKELHETSSYSDDAEPRKLVEIELEDSSVVTSDLVLWTAGQSPVVPTTVRGEVGTYGLPLADKGEAVTDQFLRVVRYPNVFALGDAACVEDADGVPLPATAQVAFQAADYAAWNVWASVNKRPLLPFRYQHLGDMMALGAADAAVALPVGDITLSGPSATLLRRAAYLYRQPTPQHAAKVAFSWLTRPLADVLSS
eukprot:gene6359-7620_t